MAGRSLLLTASLLSTAALAQFNLYPTVDPDNLAKSLGISVDCLDALNTTVTCDQSLFNMASSVDSYLWVVDNVTSLCTSDCISSAQNWDNAVRGKCGDQTMAVFGKMTPADSVSGRYIDGLGIACLNDAQDNSTTSTSTADSTPSTTSVPVFSSILPTNDTSCLLQSQQWVGSDIIRPNCTDANCDDPNSNPNNTRMANLYSSDTLCSDCFVKMMYQRLASPYLPDTDHSDFLVDQLNDISQVCAVYIPALTTRAVPSYAAIPTQTSAPTPSSNAACAGQTIQASSGQGGCDAYSTKYGVTTGDLQQATGSDDCTVTTPACLPANCTLTQVPDSATCDSLAAAASTNGFNVSTYQFLLWNPNIIGLCDAPMVGQYICTGPPGGQAILPPSPLGNSSTTAAQGRGGGDSDSGSGSSSSGDSSSSTPATSPTSTGVPIPSPTQTGIANDCTKYVQSKAGDTCSNFAQVNKISTDDLYAWNTVLGAGGKNCNTQFWTGYYYCIASASGAAPPPSTTSAPPATPAAPSPTQTGISNKCNKYAKSSAGQGCETFATANKVTPAQLYQWNAVLGTNGANCNTQFWANYNYCIGVSS